MKDFKPEFKDTNEAFLNALKNGRLSKIPSEKNFVGYYMYMGTWNNKDHFKHSLYREYLP